MEEPGDCEPDRGHDEGDQHDTWQQLDGTVQRGGGHISLGRVEAIAAEIGHCLSSDEHVNAVSFSWNADIHDSAYVSCDGVRIIYELQTAWLPLVC